MSGMKKNNNNNHNNQQQQRQRSGARVLKSKKDAEKNEVLRLEKQLARAADIEQELAALASSKKEDNKSYKLRSHLCEVLSDVLISSPRVSLERDCFQRLWRGCFYNPIRIWRQRVSREKRKRSPTLATTQEGFQQFLSEAVTLYDYLVLQYLTKLVPSATQMDMTQQSCDDTIATATKSQLEDTQYASQSTSNATTTTTASETSPLEGVVHGLYKLYIFLGDLHRYAEAYTKAEANYSNASKLGPGLGNPYNQLAVVAFSKDAYCVALYWYARSLLATHERFSTSSSNLERLFSSNRDFLREHGRDSTPTIFKNHSSSSTTTTATTTTSKNQKNNKNRNSANASMMRAQKAAASKSCLTHFVDLHYDLYMQQQQQQQSATNDDGDDDSETTAKLREKMNNVIASLRSLVLESGFSDALLCKIVVIHSFSWARASSTSAGDVSGSCLAREYMFSMGLVLGEQVEKLLTKALQKAAPGKALPSVRCLLPFEMLLDFVITMKDGHSTTCSGSSDNAVAKSSKEGEFWRCVSIAGTLVRKLLNAYKTNTTTKEDSYLRSACVSQIKEYQLLKGYRPFGIANKQYLSNTDGFLNASEAVDVLELSTTQSATQDTCTVSAMSVSTESGSRHENRARLLRMLEICEHLAKPASSAPLVFESDKYLYQESSPFASNATLLEKTDVEEEEYSTRGGHFAEDSDDDDASDVVLSHVESREDQQPPGNSRAPVSLLAAEHTNKRQKESQKDLGTANTDVVMTVLDEQPTKQVFSAIKPPPGFGGATALPQAGTPTASGFPNTDSLMNHEPASLSYNPPIDLSGLPSQSKNRNILDQVIQGRIPSTTSSSSPSFEFPKQEIQSTLPIPGLMPNSMGSGMVYHAVHNGRSNLPTSVEESIRIFGDMKTSNPFVVDPPPSAFSVQANNNHIMDSNHQNYYQNSSIIPNFVAEDNYATDDTKWLNSKLLDSLWMNESNKKTENAWAGK